MCLRPRRGKLNTLLPANLHDATNESLDRLQREHGVIDNYVGGQCSTSALSERDRRAWISLFAQFFDHALLPCCLVALSSILAPGAIEL